MSVFNDYLKDIENIKNNQNGIVQALERIENNMNSKLDKFEQNTNTRFDRIDSRLDKMDSRIDRLECKVDSHFKILIGMIFGIYVTSLSGVIGALGHAYDWF